MKLQFVRKGLLGLILGAPFLAGCGDSTNVKLADVPQITPAPATPPKPSPKIPKNARFSPPVLPGTDGK